jgi:hypothetical protein
MMVMLGLTIVNVALPTGDAVALAAMLVIFAVAGVMTYLRNVR